MTQAQFKYLKPEDIRKLCSYEFAPRIIVEGYFAGRHRSQALGLSTEFRDYRQYVPGDDLRALDWKVFARSERYYIRTYTQETNTTCYIMLDSSASMGFGTPLSKLEYSSFFTAALSYLVTKSNNLVSLEIFDDKVRQFFPLGSTRRHMQSLMHALEHNQPGNRTSLSESLRKSYPLMKQRGSLIIISDFFDRPADIFSALYPFIHKGFRIYLFHILDPQEIKLAPERLTQFVDMENGGKAIVHVASIRDLYEKTIYEHINRLRSMAVKRNVDYVMVRTDTHYFKLFDLLVR